MVRRASSWKKIGPEWRQITVSGKPEGEAKDFLIWVYVRGRGTIWLDDAKLVPLGVQMED